MFPLFILHPCPDPTVTQLRWRWWDEGLHPFKTLAGLGGRYKRWKVVCLTAGSGKAKGNESVIAVVENPQFVDPFVQGLAGTSQTGYSHVINFKNYYAYPHRIGMGRTRIDGGDDQPLKVLTGKAQVAEGPA